MPDPWSLAWEETSASADAGRDQLLTLEFHHPAFVEDGSAIAVRFVNDTQDQAFTLEDNAPLNGGEVVTFTRGAFDIDWPKLESMGITSRIRCDGIGREVSKYLPAAVKMNANLTVIFRGYLLDEPTIVGRGPFRYIMERVSVVGSRVEGQLSVATLENMKFMREVYDMKRFPALLQT